MRQHSSCMELTKMPFFSPIQEDIYSSAKGFIMKRLEQILEQSKSTHSKDAFFFIQNTMLTENTGVVTKIIDTFYMDKYPLITRFLSDLNGWIKSENTNTSFIKSITDPRFITENNNNSEYIERLKQEFARKIAEDVKHWFEEKSPNDFNSVKYSLLRKKYCLDSHCDQRKIITK